MTVERTVESPGNPSDITTPGLYMNSIEINIVLSHINHGIVIFV